MARKTLQDVARTAGVSLATVDRVMNGRPGVHADTIERVQAAVDLLKYRPDRLAARLARGRDHRFRFLLPLGTNAFMQALKREIEAAAETFAYEHVHLDVVHVDVFDGDVLAAALEDLRGEVRWRRGGRPRPSFRARGDRRPRRCRHDGRHAGLRCAALARAHYVGIDNSAAGRTAASLLGRFLGRQGGKVGIIAGSIALRDHIERQLGFSQVMSRDFPHLTLLPTLEGRDEDEQVEALTLALLRDHPDLVGIYNVGAGNAGVVAALESAGRARDIVFIGHELTAFSRKQLVRGTIDAVINQDPGHEVRSATRLLLAEREKTPIAVGQERIRIDIFLRENLP